MAEIYGYDTDEFLANLNKQNFDHPSMVNNGGNHQMSKLNIIGNNSNHNKNEEEEEAIPHKDFQVAQPEVNS